MPATPAQTFKASMLGVLTNGTAIVFDFGYALDDVGPHIDTGIAAGDFQTLVQATVLACMPGNYSVLKYRFATVHGPNAGEIGFVDAGPGHIGGRSALTLPGEVAISLKRNTGHSSRKDRGRIFFGPVNMDFTDPSRPDEVQTSAPLLLVRDLLKATLVVDGVDLHPQIIAADGSSTGADIINVAIGQIFVHRKSRRFRFAV